MTRISKKTRNEAILICAIAASTPRAPQENISSQSIVDALEALDAGWELSVEARKHAASKLAIDDTFHRTQESDALAAQMLREGWSPK